MTRGLIAAALLGCACAATRAGGAASLASAYTPPPPEPVAFPYEVIGPRDFQVFVTHWSPPSEPLCVAIRSAEEWTRIFHPAPVMGGNRPFAPPAGFWRDHIVLMIARSMPMGDVDDAIRVEGVNETAGRLQVQLGFHVVDSSATMNAWRGVVIGRPDRLFYVSFRAGSENVCTLETASANK
jgi:hypothetical protein